MLRNETKLDYRKYGSSEFVKRIHAEVYIHMYTTIYILYIQLTPRSYGSATNKKSHSNDILISPIDEYFSFLYNGFNYIPLQ
jgi:hypothetical protein